MKPSNLDVANAILRNHLHLFVQRSFLYLHPGAVFVPNWHIRALAHQLNRVARGDVKRLIINLPPRSLKSVTVSVAWPAFLLGHQPHRRCLCVSYGADLAAKHGGDFRAVVESDWYQRVFPSIRVQRSQTGEVITTARGFRKATSVLGPLTGFGADLIIIDDPIKPTDAQSPVKRAAVNQWFANTLLSRLDNKDTGAIVVVMQRVHLEDLTGFLTSLPEDWEVLSLPAIAEQDRVIDLDDDWQYHWYAGDALQPARESLASLEVLRRSMGPETFLAQYQQRPVPPGGAIIRREWLSYYDEAPRRLGNARVVQSWDVASKDGEQNSYSVCSTWLRQNEHYYLLDLVRERFDFPGLRAAALRGAEQFKPDEILIEDASVGAALAKDLNKTCEAMVTLQRVHSDKGTRLFLQQDKFAGKRVHFPRGAPFLRDLEDELLTFPQSRYDDQVDSLTQALAYEGSSYDSSLDWVGSLDNVHPYFWGALGGRWGRRR